MREPGPAGSYARSRRVLFNLAVAKNVPPDNIITKFLIKINHMNIDAQTQSLLFWINYRIATTI